ncbi:hypothetical protein GCM10012285_24120 [Streptomyces kronopolitis]|uniref:Uncharacterized protein n=1 Tax=Streptomyces kronopolitis TaxID=1612435 RepID=A0ABQ2JCA4_9ACTN|nr:hypothetical protein [Streptomyces kronopolitis]GGN43108.1 hypothetical protein GCM10012285_24120 [Streptomyces kronopolitis]
MTGVHDNQRSAAVNAATAQLTALTGNQPRVTEEHGVVRIEVEVPEDLLANHWPRLHAVLDLGTTYGLRTTTSGNTAWLRFETGDTPRP